LVEASVSPAKATSRFPPAPPAGDYSFDDEPFDEEMT
jgi:hypothetical protein